MSTIIPSLLTTERGSHPILKFWIPATYIRKFIYGQAGKIIYDNHRLIYPLEDIFY